MSIPIFLINRNWLSSTQSMCSYLEKLGLEIVIVDNDSSYPPLVEWYCVKCPYEIVRLQRNAGHHSPWDYGVIPSDPIRFRKMWGQDYYLVSDCDLDLSGIPDNLIAVLKHGFVACPKTIKVGVSLEINDIPEHNREFALSYEHHYWKNKIDNNYWDALVDTTLFMTKCTIEPAKIMHYESPNLRADRPYTAKHLPWYITPENITEEQKYYYDHADNIHNTFQWAHILAERKIVLN